MDELLAQAALRRKLRAAERRVRRQRNASPDLPVAWFLTDPSRTPDPVAIVARLPAGWGVIYRHFGAENRIETARVLALTCRRQGLKLLISADPGLVRAVRANGVHWPEQRLPRHLTTAPGVLATTSAHGPPALRRAARAGCSAAFLSPVFPTRSAGSGKPMGVQRFRALVRRSPLLVFALGGIDARTAMRLAATGEPNLAGFGVIDGIVDAFG